MPLPLAPVAGLALRYGLVALTAYAVSRRLARSETSQLCEDALVRHIDRETVVPLHAVAILFGARELRCACEDYVLQLGGARTREVRGVLAQMVEPWWLSSGDSHSGP